MIYTASADMAQPVLKRCYELIDAAGLDMSVLRSIETDPTDKFVIRAAVLDTEHPDYERCTPRPEKWIEVAA